VIAGWPSLTQAERDAAYNNSEAVANSPELVERRNAASVAFRKAHPASLDVPYGSAPRQKWDLFAARDASAPCLVFIHGGYWQRNAREDFACFAEGVMAHGWSMALPGYTLAPEASLAAIVDEIRRALDWLAASGPAHGVAAGPVVVSGWSAGGHLTAMVLSHPRVAAGLAISGVYELGPIRETYLNEKLRLTDQEVAMLSPLRLPVVPKPMAIAYGTKELQALVDDSRDLHARRAAAHAAGPLIPIAGADHFTIMDELRRPDGALVAAAQALLGANSSGA
jgi:acetyl esterase/lipase